MKSIQKILPEIARVSFRRFSCRIRLCGAAEDRLQRLAGIHDFRIAKQKGWFKDAGLDVDLVWFDYLPSLDAFAAGKVDAVTAVATDALVSGANGAKSKIIALLDYSDGSDMIIGKPGIESIKDLKGQKVGIEATLVEHLLLLEALKQNGMTQSDVEIVNTATNETPQTLASGKVAAVGAWYPVSSQALKQVPGSKKLFTSSDAKGLDLRRACGEPGELCPAQGRLGENRPDFLQVC